METNLLDRMLDTYQRDRTVLTITLQNKVRITGTIRAFDSYVIVLGDDSRDIVFRHAVSSVMPSVRVEPKPLATPKQRPARPVRAEQTPSDRNGAKAGRGADRGRKPAPQQQRPPDAPDTCINTGMKDGLLKWMQERKASGK